MAETANAAGVKIVAGDTKVVERGSADKIFINTAGVGWIREGCSSLPTEGSSWRQDSGLRKHRGSWHGQSSPRGKV